MSRTAGMLRGGNARVVVGLALTLALSVATVGVASAGPAPGRTIAVVPNADLVGGDAVTITGSGFTPNSVIFYCQGVDPGGPPSPNNCGSDVPISNLAADSQGSFSTTFTVRRLVRVSGAVIDCAQSTATCVIGASDFNSPNSGIATAPITFTAQDPLPPAEIHGRVTDSGNNPIAGVRVGAYLSADGFLPSLAATTDGNGDYLLENVGLNEGYRIRFGAPAGSAFASQWYRTNAASPNTRQTATVVNAALPDLTQQIDVVLDSSGSISGVVQNTSGAPVAGVTVRGYLPFDRYLGAFLAVTAADGTFRIDGVAGSGVKLFFVPTLSSGLKKEWFDDVATRPAATALTVAPGQTLSVTVQLAAA